MRHVVLPWTQNGGHLRATRLFVRRAKSGLYFYRVPSLPATDDGSARPLAEDLSNGSGGSEDITWDVDTEPDAAHEGVVPEAAGGNGRSHPIEAEPRATLADAVQGVNGLDAETEFTAADVAFMSAPPETGRGPAEATSGQAGGSAGQAEASPGPAEMSSGQGGAGAPEAETRPRAEGPGIAVTPQADEEARADGGAPQMAGSEANLAETGGRANGAGTQATPVGDAGAPVAESGRWFRPAGPKKRYLSPPPHDLADAAESSATEAAAGPGGAAAMPGPAAPGAAETDAAETGAAETDAAETDAAETGVSAGEASAGPAAAVADTGITGAGSGKASAGVGEAGAGQDRTSGAAPPASGTEPAPDATAGSAPSGPVEPGTAQRPRETVAPQLPAGAAPPRPGGLPRTLRTGGTRTGGTRTGGTRTGGTRTGGTRTGGARTGGTGLLPPGSVPPRSVPLPDSVPPGPVAAGQAEHEDGRRRLSRRTVLQASLIGGAGVAALPLLALVGGITRPGGQPTSLTFSMNTNWLFGGQYTQGSESSFYDDGNFAPVTLPHTVTPLSWDDWDYAGWQQVWIYRRHFSGAQLLDPHQPGNRIFVDFDGVMVNAAVAINDRVVSTHQGGYLPFSAELTGKVTAGDNLLAVIVDSRCLPVPPVGMNQGPASVDFFQPGGIYRDVRLRVLPQVFLADLSAQPADVLTSQPRVDIGYTVDSAADTHTSGTLLAELLDGQSVIATQAVTVRVTSPGTSTGQLSLTGFGPADLWSPDHPKLYTVRATLTVPGLGSHVLTRRIGFREAVFRPQGFFLNGQRLPLFGLNRHQLYPYAGMAMPARVQRKDAEILKNEFNCNMVRCSHYPQSPDFLDACDELGLLVWEEAPGWHNVSTPPAWQDLVVQNVRDMVIRDRSRPSVIIWGTRLNETPDIPGLWAATRQAARELDSSRPSSGAMAFHTDTTWNEDVFAYNDYTADSKTGNVALKPPFAGVPYLITEAVGVEGLRPPHFAWTDAPAWLARQAELHGQAQSQARTGTGYAGLLAWAGFDYASMQGQSGNVKWAGVADGFRVPKPGAAIYQTQGDPAVRPVIIPVFFWEPGGPVPSSGPAPSPTAMIASNCDRLEVFIGGRHVASALPAFGSPLYSGLVHPPFLVRLPGHIPGVTPELRVQGFVRDQQVALLRMSADPAGDALGMAVDDATISADGSDATRAVFRAIDAYGNQRRYGSGEVALTLSGPARLVGDNPFAFGRYGGLGAVWIRSVAGQPGTITLTASHPLLGQAQVQVRAERANRADELA